MLKRMSERTPPCGTPDLNWRFVDEWFLNGVSFDVVCDMRSFSGLSLTILVLVLCWSWYVGYKADPSAN